MSKVVPKRAFFFWGNEKMSWLRYMTLCTFRKLNPSWGMQLYRSIQQRSDKYWSEENEQDFFKYDGQDYSDRLADIPGLEVLPWELRSTALGVGPSHQSNFFKWEQLAGEGGVYLDMDIAFLKPIDQWYERIKNADTAICFHPESYYFSIGMLASTGNNAFYRDVYTSCESSFRHSVYQSAGVASLYRLLGRGKGIWDRMINRYPEKQFVNFGMDYIYPFDCTKIPEIHEATHKELPDITFAIHWYAGHPLSQQANIDLNDRTVHDIDSTLAYHLRKVL